jgi:hypoxanthine phosphoribosyltransferase
MFTSTNTGNHKIPPELYRGAGSGSSLPREASSTTTEQDHLRPGSPEFQLSASTADIGGMLERAYRGSEERLFDKVCRAIRCQSFWSGPHISLAKIMVQEAFGGSIGALRAADHDAAKKVVKFCNSHFDPVTGAVRLNPEVLASGKANPLDARLREFFREGASGDDGVGSERVFQRSGKLLARGASFYAAMDDLLTIPDKLDRIERDIIETTKILRLVDQKKIDGELFWLVLGALDYAKSHSLSLYNAVTFEERKGQLSQDSDYQMAKASSLKLAELSTITFYRFLLGHDIQIPSVKLRHVAETVRDIVDYLRTKRLDTKALKLQECDHPLVIALHANENALRFYETEVIVALPLGGLQSGFVTRFAFNEVLGTNPDLLIVPLSTHNGSEKQSRHLSVDEIVDHILTGSVKGKNVLVTEDNSNTGRTAKIISDALRKAHAVDVHVAVIEKDPRRVFIKQALTSEGERKAKDLGFVANLDHPDFDTAIRPVPVLCRIPYPGMFGVQLVRSMAHRVIANYQDAITKPSSPKPTE